MENVKPTYDDLIKQIALLESENLMLWDKSLAGNFMVQNGRFCTINQIALLHTGYSSEELIGQKADILIYPEDVVDVKKNARAMLAGNFLTPYEFRIVTKNGQIRWLLQAVAASSLRGQPSILGNSMDITALKTAEDNLRKSESFYRTLFETTGSATMIMEEDMTISLVNSEFERMTGYSKAQAEGKLKWTEMVLEEDIQQMINYHKLRRVAPNAAPRNYEFRLVDSRGEIKNILLTVDVIPGTGKSIVSDIDITEWKKTQIKLKESENIYRAIFETTGTATMIMEEDMTISLANSGFEKITGYRKEDWEGKKKWTELVSKEDLGRMMKYHKQRRKNPKSAPLEYEYQLIDNKGRTRTILNIMSMIEGTRKSVSSFLDITEMRENERELKTKSDKLAELNTALTVLLNKRGEDTEEIEQRILSNVTELVIPYIDVIKRNCSDQKDLTNIKLLESNLKDIIAPFTHTLSSKYLNLTPKEIHVASLIKEGKSSKEIADMMNVSKSAVDVHRYKMRKKVGLNSKKVNLRNHLIALVSKS